MKKFFVISLPRTGTKSICKMAKICGLTVKHVLGSNYENVMDMYNFFADTPCYRPSFIEKQCQNDKFDANFIYIEKDFQEIFNSWVKVKLFRNYNSLYNQYFDQESKPKMTNNMIYDIESYHEAFSETFLDENNFSEIFQNHKEVVTEIIKKYDKSILFYKFSEGWDTFCNFLGCEVIGGDLPHINKDTMFESID